MKIITRILSKKVSTILLGMKIRYKLKKKLIRIKKYTIKYRIIHINNIDNGQNNLTTFECLETNFFMTASNILNNLNLVGEMYLTLGKKLFRLKEDDFLFDKCLFLEDKNIKNNNVNGLSTFSLLPDATIFVINSIKHNWFTSCQNLRVLIIKKSFVQNVCLDDLKFLNYLDLSHNYLEHIKITKTLQHCNLSHNNLSWCNVRAHFMDLSYNSITFIDSEFKFHNLNLSFNPLEVLSANGNLINISNTKIKNVLCRGIKRLICRNNKNVVLYCTENVSYLDLDNCGLEFLKLNQNNSLEVVKLRNNKLTSLPNLGRLKYLDVSGNKLCCFGKYPAVYINVSRNPIRYILSSNNYTHVDLSYINIDRSNIKIDKNNGKSNGYNDHLIANLNQMRLSSKQVIKKKHNFKRIKKIVVTIPRLTFCKFIFVTALDSELNLENFLKMALSIVDTKIDNHNFFMKLIDLYEKFIRESLCSAYFYSIMIEENLISVKSTNLPLMFASFVVHEIIENDKIFVFENIGDWNCFPLLGCTDFIRRRSSYLKPYSIYCYMDIYCSYTKDFEIKNNIELYKGGNRDIKVVKDIVLNSKCLKNDFEIDINSYNDWLKTKSIIPTYGFNTCSVSHLEYLTLDTEKLLPTPGFVHSKEDKISHDKSTFIFLKINSTTSRNPITSSPYNYIIGVLCKSFQTILFEQHDNQCSVFLGFNCKQGLIFAMYIYRIMIYKGINLSIGVACGDLSIRWSHLFPKVFGFGLNKSARFASMGEGVFCCKCMKIDHKDLAYKFHGKKFMKGFDESYEVYSVHFKHPYKIFM